MKKIIVLIITSLLINSCSYKIIKEEFEENQKYYERVNKICEDKD